MPASFDPYYKWLAIPPEEQPPNHYRLLGIRPFETDPDVIETAADQRMIFLRTFQAGQNGAFSQKLLNEVAVAKLCLLTPEKKAAYDRPLREKLAIAKPPAAPPPKPPLRAVLASSELSRSNLAMPILQAVAEPEPLDFGSDQPRRSRARRSRNSQLPVAMIVGCTFVLVACGLAFVLYKKYWAGTPPTDPRTDKVVASKPANDDRSGAEEPPDGAANPQKNPASDPRPAKPSRPPADPPSKGGPDPDLLVHLPLKRDFRDASGHNLHGKPLGNTTIHSDGYAEFDGHGDFIALPHIALDGRPFAVCFWVKLNGKQPDNSFVQQIGGPGQDHVLHLETRANRQPYLGFYSDDLQGPRSLAADGQWQHLVFQYRAGQQEIWIDGRPTAQRKSAPYAGTTGATIIGQTPKWTNSPHHDLDGALADFRIYGRALSPAEIAALTKLRPKNSPPKTDVVITRPPDEEADPTHPGMDETAPLPEPAKPVQREVPDEEAQAAALRQVQEAFADQFRQARKPPEKLQFAEELLRQAVQTNDPASRFVMLKEAGKLAASAGEAQMTMQVIDTLAQEFAVDSFAMKAKSVASIAKLTRTADQTRDLAEAALALTGDALAADNYEEAKRLGAIAQAAARVTKDVALTKTVVLRVKEIDANAKAFAKLKSAMATLEQTPDDAEANQQVGEFRCLVQGDWSAGLPMLAAGTDAELKDLAARDLAQPSAAAEQQVLADEWWKLAETRSEPAKRNLQARAVYWYEQALPALSGLKKTAAEKRLKDFAALDTSKPVKEKSRRMDWSQFRLERGQIVDDFVRLTNGKVETLNTYSGPLDITIVARTSKDNIRLWAYGRARVIWNWEIRHDELRVHRPDGTIATGPTEPLDTNTWYKLRWVTLPDELSVYINDRLVFQERRDFNLAVQSTVYVQTVLGSVVDVKSFVVQPAKQLPAAGGGQPGVPSAPKVGDFKRPSRAGAAGR